MTTEQVTGRKLRKLKAKHERAVAALREVEKILVEDTNALDHSCCGWGATLAMVRAALDDAESAAGDAG
jgi:hypothetical protein